eukprot:9179666-Prorocentrum_lima.AAC.1
MEVSTLDDPHEDAVADPYEHAWEAAPEKSSEWARWQNERREEDRREGHWKVWMEESIAVF